MSERRTTTTPTIRRCAAWIGLTALGLLIGTPAAGQVVKARQKPATAPAWYSRLPNDARVLYAKATATSKDKQLAIDKAVHDARVELGRLVQGRVDSIRRSVEREAGLDRDGTERFANIGQKISVELKGSRVKNQKQSRKGKTWTAFVVVELPVGAASDALVRAVKDDGTLSPTFGPTQAFRALDAEAAAYRSSLQKKKK